MMMDELKEFFSIILFVSQRIILPALLTQTALTALSTISRNLLTINLIYKFILVSL